MASGKENLDYRIIEGSEKIQIEDIKRLLGMTYWADKRPIEQIAKSVRNSSCYGIILESSEKLIGFARVISDYATTFYLCDVIIDTDYRNRGLGTALVSHILSLSELSGLRGILLTRDAHAFYRKFGFEAENERAMVKAPEIG